jgi:hypothetical protein
MVQTVAARLHCQNQDSPDFRICRIFDLDNLGFWAIAHPANPKILKILILTTYRFTTHGYKVLKLQPIKT